MAVELVDPRRALEVAPRNLSLPCRDRWLELVLIGVGCLGLDIAQRLCAAEAHLLHVFNFHPLIGMLGISTCSQTNKCAIIASS